MGGFNDKIPKNLYFFRCNGTLQSLIDFGVWPLEWILGDMYFCIEIVTLKAHWKMFLELTDRSVPDAVRDLMID